MEPRATVTVMEAEAELMDSNIALLASRIALPELKKLRGLFRVDMQGVTFVGVCETFATKSFVRLHACSFHRHRRKTSANLEKACRVRAKATNCHIA